MKRRFLPFIVLLLFSAASARAASEKITFVVHAENPATRLSADEIRDYYLKRRGQWPDGTPVRFIDWEEGHSLRGAFLGQVVKKSPRELELYWIGEKLYRGNSAPIKVATPEMVLAFVSRLAGAIGYIPENTTVRNPKVRRIEFVPEDR